jgi:hypothetical protein
MVLQSTRLSGVTLCGREGITNAVLWALRSTCSRRGSQCACRSPPEAGSAGFASPSHLPLMLHWRARGERGGAGLSLKWTQSVLSTGRDALTLRHAEAPGRRALALRFAGLIGWAIRPKSRPTG